MFEKKAKGCINKKELNKIADYFFTYIFVVKCLKSFISIRRYKQQINSKKKTTG